MKPTARTILTHSLLVPMALAVAAALAACAGESAGGGNGVTAAGSAGASTGSAGASAATGVGAAAPAGEASGGGTAANVLAEAKALICPPPGPALGRLNAGAARQVIPAGFSPVAVVQCRATGAIAPVAGQLAYVRKEVAVADLRPLLVALQEPSAPRSGPGPTPGCPVLTMPVPELALIGRDGTVIYPRIPVTVCGAAIAPVTASLAVLHWITLSTTSPQQAGQPQAVQPQGGRPQGASTPPIVVQPAS
jgi:hypothetical protein